MVEPYLFRVFDLDHARLARNAVGQGVLPAGKYGCRVDIHTQGLTDPKEQWDKLVPHRWFYDALPNGPQKGAVAYEGNPDKLFNEALPAYWKERGWTEDKGIPTQETLKALGIDDIAADIAKQHL